MAGPLQAASVSGHPDSWYAATARDVVEHASLAGTVTADVCVVGAGYTGLSAALHLAGQGWSVVLLEAERVGSGASGRNGGQVGTGQRRPEDELEQMFGAVPARQLFDLGLEARNLVRGLVERHRIACDLTAGQLLCAARPAHLEALRQRADRLASHYDYPHQQTLSRQEMAALVLSPAYHGGVLDADACHLHPLNYALGLARACEVAGVRIFEQSRVTGYSGTGPVQVRTARGQVQARYLVLGCNGYLEGLEPRIAPRIMPINNFLLATSPLPEDGRAFLRSTACVHDTLFVVNYFRLSPDGRLIFGGGENYRRHFPPDLKAFVRRHLLRIFPQAAETPIDHAWGGTLAITMNRLPHLGRLEGDVYFAQGYSGHGVSTATLAGQLIAEAVAGTAGRFDVFARIPPPAFPGGTLFRWPGMVLGMLWYALRDRL